MLRKRTAALITATIVLVVFGVGRPMAAQRPDLSGRWTLNRELSQFPRDLGFGMDLLAAAGTNAGAVGGGRGGGSSPTGAAFLSMSEEDARRMKLLVDVVRNPSPHLTIAASDAAVTITDDGGRTLTFHPDGREETQNLDQVPIVTTTRWEATGLVVRYAVQKNRELRYTFSRKVNPPQLVVLVQFIERGGHDSVTRVYDTAGPDVPAQPDRAAPAPQPPKAVPEPPPGSVRASDLGKPPAPWTPPVPGAPPAPAAPERAPAPVVAGGPDAELRGLTALGVVVEDLGAQAAACGLDRTAIEAAVSKSFTDRGFTVRRNADEDTYVYVHIMTTSTSGGLCVSGYDAYVYTHTNAVLPYQSAPVLVQVVLLHKGGMAGGPPAAHAAAVLRDVKQYVDDFATRMRNANQPRR